jgi:hypothetical protein
MNASTMRWLCSISFLGIAVACAGDPFVSSAEPEPQGAVAGSGGGATGGVAPMPDATSAGVSGKESSSGRTAGGASPSSDAPATTGGEEPAAAGGATGEGDGGAATAPTCPSRTAGDWALGFFPELSAATTQESHPFFQISNVGAGVTTLNRVKIRYYFSKESDGRESAVCYWVTGDRCPLARMFFGDVPTPTATSSRYLEVTFPGASNVMLFPGTFEVRVGFKTGTVPMLQSNDYSFDPNANPPSTATPFPYKRWLRTTLYVDGELVWGNEPCPSG